MPSCSQDAASPLRQVPFMRHPLSGKGALCDIALSKMAQDAASISWNPTPAACARMIADPVSPVFSKCMQHAGHLRMASEARSSGEKMPLGCRLNAGSMPDRCRIDRVFVREIQLPATRTAAERLVTVGSGGPLHLFMHQQSLQ